MMVTVTEMRKMEMVDTEANRDDGFGLTWRGRSEGLQKLERNKGCW